MTHGPHRGTAAAVIVGFSLSLLLPGRPEAASVQLVQAGGRPYVDCVGGPAQLLRMETAIAQQHRDLERTRDLLRKAESGTAEATKQTEDAMMAAAKKIATEKINLAKRVRALKELGLSQNQRREFLELLKDVEERFEKVEKAQRRDEAYDALMQSGLTLQNLGTFLESSGINDDTASAAALALAGPAGAGVIEVFILARDLIFSGVGQVISENELAQARQNNARLENAVRLHQDRIDRLRALLVDPANCPAPRSQTQSSPRPIPPQEAAAPAPPAPAPEPAAKKKGGSGKAVSLLIGTGVAIGGGLYISKTLASLEDLDGDGTGSGSGSGQPTLRSFTQWTCSGSTCAGDVVINFPMTISSGSIIVFSSPGSWAGQALVSPSAPPGDVTIRMTRSYNTCYGTQTGLAIWNATNANGPNTWSLTSSIPVTCR